MMTTMHPTAEQYLKQLEAAARTLPRRERDELVVEIREHLTIGIPAEATEADVRNVLDDLGSPADIVASAQPVVAPGTPRRGAREAWALALLIIGLPPIVGWLVGLALLTWSPMWSAREKWLAVVVSLGGLPGVWLFFNFLVPVLLEKAFGVFPLSEATVIAAVAWLVLQIGVALYLYRAAGKN